MRATISGVSGERYEKYNDKAYKKRYLSRNTRGIMTRYMKKAFNQKYEGKS